MDPPTYNSSVLQQSSVVYCSALKCGVLCLCFSVVYCVCSLV